MERFSFKITAQKTSRRGKVIEGLALPFGEYSDADHPDFYAGLLVDYGYPRPLLLEHDFRNRIGDVTTLYEKDDGIYFVAKVNDGVDTELPQGVSIGGEYIIDGMGNVTALYIYEISLVEYPAYSTTYQLVATNKNNLYMETVNKVKAQEEQLNALIQEVTAINERLTAIEERVSVLEQALQQLTQQAEAAMNASYSAVKSSENMVEEAKRLLAEHSDVLADNFKKQMDNVMEILDKTINLIKKR